MKYIALLLILANVGFFFFHNEIIQKTAQLEPSPLPKDIPQLKLVKEINNQAPAPQVNMADTKNIEKTESPIIDEPPIKEKNKLDQIVAVANADTISQEDPVKIATQAFDVLKTLKNEADRMTSSIDQAVSVQHPAINPPPTTEQSEKEPPTKQEIKKPSETTPLKTLTKEETLKEKTEKIFPKIIDTKTEEKPQITSVEKAEEKIPVKEEKSQTTLTEKIEKETPVTIVDKTNAASSESDPEGGTLEEVKDANSEESTDQLPITLAAQKKNNKKGKKSCYYSGIYEKKIDATRSKQWLDKQKVSSKIKDWKNRIKSGKIIFLPAANRNVANKLLKRLAAKKIKDYTLIRNDKDGYLINLGAFRTDRTLQNRLTELKKKGFYGLKIQDRYLDIPVFRLKIEATPSQRSILENFSTTFRVPKPQPIDCDN
jgi:hypothetical protein